MALPLAMLLVTLIAVVGNRIFAVFAALWWHVPAFMFLPVLIAIDLVQIPVFFWLYKNGAGALQRLPSPFNRFFKKDWSVSRLGKWAAPLGGFGVMFIAAMPTFGGGMWSAVFLAYSLGLRRVGSYFWLVMGSLLSYAIIYWMVDTLVLTIQYVMAVHS